MKTKIKLRNGGVRNNPLWHIIVQGEKKNLKGRYIERLGYWMPIARRTVPRGMVLNKHKCRYWLSVGAQPTRGAAVILHKYGLWPKLPVPWGSASLYEKPEKQYGPQGFRDPQKRKVADKWHYRQMLQEQMNLVERKSRAQAEAMENLGAGAQELDLELVKTDDIESEEGDIFERAKKFKELERRFARHRKEQRQLKGNDLRYNVYLKKLNKLTRMDLGLDVEGYKDYINNIKQFAKYDTDYQILAQDSLESDEGGRPRDPLLKQRELEHQKKVELNAKRRKQFRNTLGKLARSYHSQIYSQDRDIINEFAQNPRLFIDEDAELAIELKQFSDKRGKQIKLRAQIGVAHMENVTEEDAEAAGVSKREFGLIKKLMKLDPNIFAAKEAGDSSPYTYSVDLSKYDNSLITQDCREILFRPQKMRYLYEQYWQLASQQDKDKRDQHKRQSGVKWYQRMLNKTEEEYKLIDKVMAVLDRVAEDDLRELQNHQAQLFLAQDEGYNKLMQQMTKQNQLKAEGKHPDRSSKFNFKDAFEYHAEQIMQQIKIKEFCTKSQLEYLILYNEVTEFERPYHFSQRQVKNVKVVRGNLGKQQKKETQAALDVNSLPQELKEKFEQLDKPMGYIKKTKLLSWFVDSMRSSVLNHFEVSEALKSMKENEKMALVQELNELHQKCADQLFQMNKDRAESRHVEENDNVERLLGEINAYLTKIDIIQLQTQQLQMISKHNSGIDAFTGKLDQNELLAQMAKLEDLRQGGEPDQELEEEHERIAQQLSVMEQLPHRDRADLVEKLNRRVANSVLTEAENKSLQLKELSNRLYSVERHGLSYAKLYQDFEGGYNMEQLKKVLEQVKQDKEEGLHPFIDPAQDRELEQKLKKTLKEYKNKKAESKEASEGKEEDEEDQSEEAKAAEALIAEFGKTEEEKEMAKDLIEFLNDRTRKENEERGLDGNFRQFGPSLSKEALDTLEELYIKEQGLHLQGIEDPEEWHEAWVEWIKERLPKRASKKKPKPSEWDERDAKLRAENPLYAELADALTPNYPASFFGDRFVPTDRGYHKEMDRIEETLGRYTPGFRHYECYESYRLRHPNATAGTYHEDMNSQISFDEFSALAKKAFLYEATQNPTFAYRFKWHGVMRPASKGEPSDRDAARMRNRAPEVAAESPEFTEWCEQQYAGRVHDALLEKEWFTKVEALELFTNFWSFGRGISSIPETNVYIPVRQTILPRPKFRDMQDEDQEGKQFTYRTRESHTVQPALIQPNTLKPVPFAPALPSDAKGRSQYAHKAFTDPPKKFKRSKRLSKPRRDKLSSVNIGTGQRFFSAYIHTNNLSEEEEYEAIRQFNSQNLQRANSSANIFSLQWLINKMILNKQNE